MHTREKVAAFASGLMGGAALMYLFDPARGRTRRVHTRDKLLHVGHEASSALDVARHDLKNRGLGFFAELRGRLRDGRVDDEVLAERVRAKLGRFTSHPRAIEVAAYEGRVRLRGPVLTREAAQLIRRVSRVRGVHAVDDALERHNHADLHALEGPGGVGHTFELAKRNWSPGWRLLVGAGILAAGVAALPRRRRY
jgi:hypothetical protein